MKQKNTGSSNAVKWGVTGFPWSGSGFHLTRGMTATYQGPTGKRVSLVAAAQAPGSLDPGRGSTSSATSSTTKDAGTSSMPPPSVPSSALPRADAAGSAASSQGSAAGQAPAAKGPPVPKTGGTPMVQGPPARPSSDSAVMAKAGTTDPQAKCTARTVSNPGRVSGEISSSEEASANRKAEAEGELIESQGSICLYVQCCYTWNRGQCTVDQFPEGPCCDTYWKGPASDASSIQRSYEDTGGEGRRNDEEEAG